MMACGDRLHYPKDTNSSAISILDTKIHINSTISDTKKGARYMKIDMIFFCLGTTMEYFQYIGIPQHFIPEDIKKEYNLVIELDGQAYFEIRRGIYGLKEAGIIAYIVKNLAPFGHSPLCRIPRVWKQESRKTTFILCVDDFDIKYFNIGDAANINNSISRSLPKSANHRHSNSLINKK